jgi:hypothetical protein
MNLRSFNSVVWWVTLLGSLMAAKADGFLFFHTVPEGNIGVYYRFGAIVPGVTYPGLHFHNSFTTAVETIYIQPQTDRVETVLCGTSDGTSITFPTIEVGNTLPEDTAWDVVKKYTLQYDKYLVFDQVRYAMSSICAGVL